MIGRIQVYNRWSMETLVADGRECKFPFFGRTWHLVSIHGDSKRFLTPEATAVLKGHGMGESLSLDFWDITDDPKLIAALKVSHPQYRLFSKRQAMEIVAFMAARKIEKGNDALVCHCDAGISRSGAVATFACESFGLDYGGFLKDNPHLSPNPMVLRMLRKAAGLGGKTAFLTAFEAEKEKRRKAADEAIRKYGHLFV
jgi:predicted protein tyrosine phosphatase